MPQMSVIIPTMSDDVRLAWTLESLCLQSFKDFEVIVVNDGGNKETQQLVQRFQKRLSVRYTYLEPPSASRRVAAARNLGFRYSTAPWITLLDGDMVMSPNTLQVSYQRRYVERITFMARLRVPIDQVTVFPGDLNYTALREVALGDPRFRQQPLYQMCFGCHASMHASLYHRLGGMDERFVNRRGEDTDFFWRCFQSGAEFWPLLDVAPCFHLEHHPRSPPGQADLPSPWFCKYPLVRNGGALNRYKGPEKSGRSQTNHGPGPGSKGPTGPPTG